MPSVLKSSLGIEEEAAFLPHEFRAADFLWTTLRKA